MGLDAIRGVAILLVVAYHYMTRLPAGTPVNLLTRAMARFSEMGWSGVDLFFVLSGFLIGGILIDHRESPTYFTTFYGRRFMRIIPLYALSLGIFALLFLYSGWQSRHLEGLMEVQISPWAFVFLVQNFSIASIGHWAGPGWLAVTWSLAVEEQFYLILPALIRYLPPARLPPLCIAAVIAAPITRFAFLWLNPENTVAPLVLFPCRMDALFLGVLCALAYRDESIMRFLRNQRTAMSVAFIAALAAILAGSHHLNPNTFFTQVAGFSLIAVFYSLGLLIAVTEGAPSSWLRIGRTPLVWAGIGAYSMYLFHRPIQGLIEGYLGYESLVGRLASLLAVFVFALICWRLIERPAITFGRRLQYRGKRAAPLRQSALRPPSTARGGVAAEES